MPWNMMGKSISYTRRQRAYEYALEMGLSQEISRTIVEATAQALECDQPFEAQRVGMQALDLTGTYRLMAVLLS